MLLDWPLAALIEVLRGCRRFSRWLLMLRPHCVPPLPEPETARYSSLFFSQNSTHITPFT